MKKLDKKETLTLVEKDLPQDFSKILLKPRKPVMPYLGKEPEREVLVPREICIPRHDNLADLLAEIPEGIDYKNVRIANTYEDEFYLEYDVLVENVAYEREMEAYEKKKVMYEERLKLYWAQKKIYDEWEGLSEEEKRNREEERKRLIKQSKIAQLERQIEELRKDVEGT